MLRHGLYSPIPVLRSCLAVRTRIATPAALVPLRRTTAQVSAAYPCAQVPSVVHTSTSPFHSLARTQFDATNSPKPPAPTKPFHLDSAMAELGSNFADARMDIEDAVESLGTTYYPSDIQQAIDSVNRTLLLFESIQSQLGVDAPQAVKLRESWSLRLEQLKQELQQAIAQGGGEEH